jgi:hypothetical protein
MIMEDLHYLVLVQYLVDVSSMKAMSDSLDILLVAKCLIASGRMKMDREIIVMHQAMDSEVPTITHNLVSLIGRFIVTQS